MKHIDERTSPLKVASASFIGTTVEYYDFFIYGTAAALVFPALFFPESSPLVGTLLAFATLGVGFLARPVGGVVFGHFGDKVGRKKMLVISSITMGCATVRHGPDADLRPDRAGRPDPAHRAAPGPGLRRRRRMGRRHPDGGRARPAGAPRILWRRSRRWVLPPASASPPSRSSSPPNCPRAVRVAGVGGCRSSASAVLVLVGLVIRLTIAESPEFEAVRENGRPRSNSPSRKRSAAIPRDPAVAGTYLSQGVFAYICMSYLVSYAPARSGSPRPSVLIGVFAAAVVAVDPVPGVRIPRRPVGPQDHLSASAPSPC